MINSTTFPKIFKLRGGAGSSNVRLIRSKEEALLITKKSFRRGHEQFNRIGYLKDRLSKWRNGKDDFLGVLKGIGRLFIPTEYSKMHHKEKGYVYFQDFIPNNDFDIRVIVIGDKAFAIKRKVRQGDFRASGGGNICYNNQEVDPQCIQIAFDINKKLESQCIAYDFIFDSRNKPLIVEISYGFIAAGYDSCPGYWDSDLEWHEGSNFDFCGWIIENLIWETKLQKESSQLIKASL